MKIAPFKILSFIILFLITSQSFCDDLISIAQRENHSISDIYNNFNDFKSHYEAKGDRRKLFVKIYKNITENIELLIHDRKVSHDLWLEGIIIDFAEEYRKAVFNYELKNFNKLPLPWKFDFDHAKDFKIGLATQLLFSLNSHILHDLPYVVSQRATSTYDLILYKEDYFKLNEMFKSLTPVLFQMVYREAGFGQVSYFHPAEVIKRKVVDTLVVSMRKVAWERAMKLASLRSEVARKIYMKEVELHTVKVSEIVMDLDPFLSTKPGEIIPKDVLSSTWVAINKIFDLLELESPSTELDRLGLKSLLSIH